MTTPIYFQNADLEVNGNINISNSGTFRVGGQQISTANIVEHNTKLFYTDTRARGAISFVKAGGEGSLSYNSTTGVITYTGPASTDLVTGGTGVTVTQGVVSIGQAVATTDSPTFQNLSLTGGLRGPTNFIIDPAVVGDDTGTVEIKGNLVVQGTTTTINSTTVTIDDKNFVIADGSSTLSALDTAGIDFGTTAVKLKYYYNLGTNSGLSLEGTNFGIGTSSPTATLDVSGTFKVSGNSSLATVTAGTWNGTTIAVGYGGTGLTTIASSRIPYASALDTYSTSSNLTFDGTTLTSNAISVTSTTQSTDSSTGALVISGGVGVSKNVNIGGTLNVSGTSSLATISSGTWNGSVIGVAYGGLGLSTIASSRIPYASALDTYSTSANLTFDGTTLGANALSVTSTVDSTSISTGSLIVAGGVGVAKSVFLGTTLSVAGNATLSGSANSVGTVTSGTWNGSVIGVAYGGTGLSSIAADRIPYASASNTYSTSSNLTFNGTTLALNATLNSTSTSTGSLVVAGGVGVGGKLYTSSVNVTSPTGLQVGDGGDAGGFYTAYNQYGIDNGETWVVQDLDDPVGATFRQTSTNKYTSFKFLNNQFDILNYTGSVTRTDFSIDGTNGNVTVRSTADSTSSATGALMVLGGLGVAKAAFFGTTLNVAGNTTLAGTANSVGTITSGTWNGTAISSLYGGTGLTSIAANRIPYASASNTYSTSANLTFDGTNLTLSGTTESTGTATGALVTSGGIGVAKNAYIGGILDVLNTTESTSITSGSFQTDGGVGIAKNVWVGGTLNVNGYSGSFGNTTLVIAPAASTTFTDQIYAIRFGQTSSNSGIGPYSSVRGMFSKQGVGVHVSENDEFSIKSNSWTNLFGVEGGTGNTRVRGILTAQNTTESTSTSTGGLISSGGLGVAKNTFIGGTLNVTGNVTLSGTGNSVGTISSGTWNGSTISVAYGGLGLTTIAANRIPYATATDTYGSSANLTFDGVTLSVASTTESTSVSTGAIVTSGGLGVAKNLSVGGNLNVTGAFTPTSVNASSTTDSTSISTGAIVTAGGLGVAKNVFIGGNLNVSGSFTPTSLGASATTESTSTSTGAITTSGGVGIAKNLYVGGSANFANDITATDLTLSSSVQSGTPGTTGQYLVIAGSTFTDSNTAASGTAANMAFHSIGQPTLAATNANVTTTSASTLYIAGGPATGTNQTLTNSYAVRALGVSQFDRMFLSYGDGTQNNMALSFRRSDGNVSAIGMYVESSNRFTIFQGSGSGAINLTTNGGYVEITGSTQSATSSTTGSFRVAAGGIGIANTTDATSSTNGGSLTTAGGVAIAKQLFVGTNLVVNGTTSSTSSSTGALVVSGGLGISNTTDASSTTNGGSITTAGGLAVAKNTHIGGTLNVTGNVTLSGTGNSVGTITSGTWDGSTIAVGRGGTGLTTIAANRIPYASALDTYATSANLTFDGSLLSVASTTESTNTSTGALVTAGGLGVAKNVFVGGNTDVAGEMNLGNSFRRQFIKHGLTGFTVNNLSTVNVPILELTESSTSGARHVVLTLDYYFQHQRSMANFNTGGFKGKLRIVILRNGANFDYAIHRFDDERYLFNDDWDIFRNSVALTFKINYQTTSLMLYAEFVNSGTQTDATRLFTLNNTVDIEYMSGQSSTLTLRDTVDAITTYTTTTSASVYPLTVKTSGRVGIMTNSPVQTLDVAAVANSTNVNGGVRISTTGTQGTSAYRFSNFNLKSDGSTNFRTAFDVRNDGSGSGTTIEAMSIAQSTGVVTIGNTVESTSTATGGLVLSGGLGIAKNVFIGGTLNVSGAFTPTSLGASATTESTSISTGAITTSGGVGIAKNLYVGGLGNFAAGLTATDLVLSATTVSTSSSTGALRISGGLAISNTTDASSTTNGGSITTAGGLAVAKNVHVGGTLNVTGNVTLSGTANAVGTITSGTWNGSTIAVGRGGTGLTTIAANRIPYASALDTYATSANLTFDGTTISTSAVSISGTTASTSSSTGALRLSAGGLSIANTTDATSSTNGGSLTTAGGVAIAKSLQVGTTVTTGGAVTIVAPGTIGYSNLANSHLLIGNSTAGLGLDTNEIFGIGANISIGTLSNNSILIVPNASVTETTATANFNRTETAFAAVPVNITSNRSAAAGSTGKLLRVSALTLTDTGTAASGTAALNYMNSFETTTLAATNLSVTTTEAANVFIDSGPTAGTNMTITDSYSLVVAGRTKLNAQLVVSNTTESTSVSTGSVTIAGGVGVAKQLLVGTNLIVNGTTSSTSSSTGTLQLSGGLAISNTTDASSTTNGGSLTTAGGLAVAKNVHVGGTLNVTGNVTMSGTGNSVGTITSGTWNGSTIAVGRGGTGLTTIAANRIPYASALDTYATSANLTFNGSTVTALNISVSGTTASTSNSTGALVVTGGVGISNTTDATSQTNGGALTVAGGFAVAKKSYLGGITEVTDTTESTSSSTGSLVVDGGLGVVKNVNIAGSVDVTGTLTTGTLNVASRPTQNTIVQMSSNTSLTSATLLGTSNYSFGGLVLTNGGATIHEFQSLGFVGVRTGNNTIGRIAVSHSADLTTASTSLFDAVGATIDFRSTAAGNRSTSMEFRTHNGTAFATRLTLAANGNLTSAHSMTFNAASAALILSGSSSSIVLSGTTTSTSSTTGALRVSGGIGIANTTDSTSATNGGSFTTAGGAAIAKNLWVGGIVDITNTTDSTAVTNGALICDGGVGIAKALTVGGNITFTGAAPKLQSVGAVSGPLEIDPNFSSNNFVRIYDQLVVSTTLAATSSSSGGIVINSGGISIGGTTDAVSTTNGGSITTAGGAAIAKNMFVGGILDVTNTTESTNTSTGALTVDGGIGVVKNLNVGGRANINGRLTVLGTVSQMAVISSAATALNENLLGTSNLAYGGLLISPGANTGNLHQSLTIQGYRNGNPNQLIGSIDASYANDLVASSSTSLYDSTGASIRFVNTSGSNKATSISLWTSTGSGEPISRMTVSETGVTSISNTSASTSSGTGGLLLSGGLGIANTTDATSSTNGGSITTAGGAAIAKNVFIGGILDVTNTTESTSTATGAIQTDGGIGIAKNAYVGGDLVVRNVNMTPSSGDLFKETTFAAANNQSSATNVTGLAFANGTVRGFKAWVTVVLDATSDLFAFYELEGIQRSSGWSMTSSYTGDNTSVTFSISSAGQVQYTSANYSGYVSLTMKFRALTIGI